jgi:hypothetical protein
MALRRLIEAGTRGCRVILCARQLSRLIPPIVSRCTRFRVPAPDPRELAKLLLRAVPRTSQTARLRLPAGLDDSAAQSQGSPPADAGSRLLHHVLARSGLNVRKALLFWQSGVSEMLRSREPDVRFLTDWEARIRAIVRALAERPTLDALEAQRGALSALLRAPGFTAPLALILAALADAAFAILLPQPPSGEGPGGPGGPAATNFPRARALSRGLARVDRNAALGTPRGVPLHLDALLAQLVLLAAHRGAEPPARIK